MLFSLLLLALVSILKVNCFSAIGHELVGGIAQAFISSNTQVKLNALLGNDPDNTNTPLQSISTWADRIKDLDAYHYTMRSHYVGRTNENPPDYCAKSMDLICPRPAVCIIDAIPGYSQRLLDSKAPRNEKLEALKFIVHFVQDLHQPLHLTSKLVGGNDAEVMFDGKITNLHAIWDFNIIAKYSNENFPSDKKFLSHLISRASKVDRSYFSLCDVSTFDAQHDCIRQWGEEINQINCDFIWKKYLAQQGNDLALDYYRDAVKMDLIEPMLIRAGVRLAYVLDTLFMSM